MTGFYNNSNADLVDHNFLRTPDGFFTILDVAGAGAGPNQGTFAHAINKGGTIAGYFIDSKNTSHGFVRLVHMAANAPSAVSSGMWMAR